MCSFESHRLQQGSIPISNGSFCFLRMYSCGLNNPFSGTDRICVWRSNRWGHMHVVRATRTKMKNTVSGLEEGWLKPPEKLESSVTTTHNCFGTWSWGSLFYDNASRTQPALVPQMIVGSEYPMPVEPLPLGFETSLAVMASSNVYWIEVMRNVGWVVRETIGWCAVGDINEASSAQQIAKMNGFGHTKR